VYVSRLRRKLVVAGQRIETVWGVGYRLRHIGGGAQRGRSHRTLGRKMNGERVPHDLNRGIRGIGSGRISLPSWCGEPSCYGQE